MIPAIAMPPEAFTEANIDHRHLPDTDGSIVNNATEHSQSQLLTTSLRPLLEARHPGGRFFVGADVGIYWRLTTPFLNGCKAPDWYFVPDVPGMLGGDYRRSYVLWQEKEPPLIAIEYVSGDGREERDRTPNTGKFWVYEQAIRVRYYVIYDSRIPSIEAYQLDGNRYAPISANAAGRYPIAALGVEFGLHRAVFHGVDLHWLRAWDSATGVMIPDNDERAEDATRRTEEATRQRVAESKRADEEARQRVAESKRADEEARQRDAESKRADEAARQRDAESKRADEAARQRDEADRRAAALAQRLRDLGIDPDA